MSEEKANILLVDDREENLIALESALADLKQNLVTARSGREALRHLLQDDFAVLIMDVYMPGLDGFETAELIRDRPRSAHTPIIFLTAIGTQEIHVAHGYSLGAVDYVFKPFDPVILRAKVAAFVELARKTRALEVEVQRRQSAEDEVRRLNDDLEKRVRSRTAELASTNRELTREVRVRKRAEEQAIRRQARIEDLNVRLQQAMTETHHRIKNNLQIIAAMLDMQLMNSNHSVPTREVRRLGTQVRTLAAVHDVLTHEAKEDGEARYLSSRDILEKLLPMLQETASFRKIRFEVGDVRLSARQGTSLALVVNELVGNAMKHAEGTIDVSLTVNGRCAILEVLDDGPGFPDGFDPSREANTGLELVQHLSQWDLGGEASFRNRESGGGQVTVTIPVSDSAPARRRPSSSSNGGLPTPPNKIEPPHTPTSQKSERKPDGPALALVAAA